MYVEKKWVIRMFIAVMFLILTAPVTLLVEAFLRYVMKWPFERLIIGRLDRWCDDFGSGRWI